MGKLTKQKICYDVTRNSDGEFARPKKVPAMASVVKKGDARVRISRVGSGFKTVVIAPELQKQARSADKATAEGARSVLRNIAREALDDYKKSLDRSSFASSRDTDKARKAAAARKKRQAAEARLEPKSNAALIAYRPQNIYESRAQRRLLKERGLKAAKTPKKKG